MNTNAQIFQLKTLQCKCLNFLTSNFTILIWLFPSFWNNKILIFMHKWLVHQYYSLSIYLSIPTRMPPLQGFRTCYSTTCLYYLWKLLRLGFLEMWLVHVTIVLKDSFFHCLLKMVLMCYYTFCHNEGESSLNHYLDAEKGLVACLN